jgi:DNA-binding NtrC family response regulator
MPDSIAAPSRILVLDDDELICRFLEKTLEKRGFVVVSETSPEDALARLSTEPFDLVVSDLNMDGLDGITFTQRVVALDLDLPVILITGSAAIETAINAVHAGAFDFIAKPVSPKALAVSMERAAEHRHLRKELRALRELAEAAPAI